MRSVGGQLRTGNILDILCNESQVDGPISGIIVSSGDTGVGAISSELCTGNILNCLSEFRYCGRGNGNRRIRSSGQASIGIDGVTRNCRGTAVSGGSYGGGGEIQIVSIRDNSCATRSPHVNCITCNAYTCTSRKCLCAGELGEINAVRSDGVWIAG